MTSEYILKKDFVQKYCPDMPNGTLNDKLNTIKKHHLLPDDAILLVPVAKYGGTQFCFKKKYVKQLIELLKQKNLKPQTVSKAPMQNRDIWIGSQRLKTWYNIQATRNEIDKMIRHAYKKLLLPDNAFYVQPNSGCVLIHRDFADELIRKTEMPTSAGLKRIEWVTASQMAGDFNCNMDYAFYISKLMRYFHESKMLGNDAFTEINNKRHNVQVLLNAKYKDKFVSMLTNGFVDNGHQWITLIGLREKHNIPCTLSQFERHMSVMLENDMIPPHAFQIKDDLFLLDNRFAAEFSAKLDILLETEQYDKENLIAIWEMKRQYNIPQGDKDIRHQLISAASTHIIPPDAVVKKRNRVYLDRAFADEFAEKMKLIHLDMGYSR